MERKEEKERCEVFRVEKGHDDEHQFADEKTDRHAPHHPGPGQRYDKGSDLRLFKVAHQFDNPDDMDETSCEPPKMKAMPTMIEKHQDQGIRLVRAR